MKAVEEGTTKAMPLGAGYGGELVATNPLGPGVSWGGERGGAGY